VSEPEKLTSRKRGRPRAEPTVGIMVRMREADLAVLDEWIAAQPDPKPSRPEAIRRLALGVLRLSALGVRPW
jgi:hypothetical protein